MSDPLQTTFIIILMAVIPPLWYLSWRSRRRMARHIDAQDEAIRILTKPPEPPDEDQPRHGLTLHQGGRAGAAILPVPILWLLRYRPNPGALVATGVAMGLAYSAVTAIAVPPSTHPGALPPYRELVIPAAGTSTPGPGSPPTSASPTMPGPAPSRAATPAATSSSPAAAQTMPPAPSTTTLAEPSPTPSSPPPTTTPSNSPTASRPSPTPARCLVTIGVGGIITVCLP